jgi:hypothetical protein
MESSYVPKVSVKVQFASMQLAVRGTRSSFIHWHVVFRSAQPTAGAVMAKQPSYVEVNCCSSAVHFDNIPRTQVSSRCFQIRMSGFATLEPRR